MTVAELNALPEPAAREALAACCAASPWVDAMLAARPWRAPEHPMTTAERAWGLLTPTQLAEAVAHHPRLGESHAAASLGERERAWSAGEQAGAGAARDDVRKALAAGNADYERRFGHTFILCASGRSAADMLAALQARLANDDATEWAITADELRKITLVRLSKLLAGM